MDLLDNNALDNEDALDDKDALDKALNEAILAGELEDDDNNN
jgi:hypothetical protein